MFLKRLSKRYIPTNTDHLLHALALAQQKKLGPARALLERHGLTRWHEAVTAFPGGWARSAWLSDHLDTIMGRRRPAGRQRATTGGNKATSKPAAKTRPAERPRKAPARATADRPAPLSGLPLLDIDIPLEAEVDLAPLLAARTARPGRTVAGTGCGSGSAISAWRRVSTNCCAFLICAASKRSLTRWRPCARC